jgi:hypothetical protein
MKRETHFRQVSIFVVIVTGLYLAGLPVCADIILAPGSTWEYTFSTPSSDWNTTSGGWTTGPAPFGNNTGGYSGDPSGLFDYQTYWAADGSDGYDLWVRMAVDLTNYDLSTVQWDLGVDNGFALYMNGAAVAAANGEGYTYRWEYSGDFSGVTLNQGINIIAVALEDHGGLTAFDMQVTGTPVPEPASVLALGACSLGAFLARRKKKKG